MVLQKRFLICSDLRGAKKQLFYLFEVLSVLALLLVSPYPLLIMFSPFFPTEMAPEKPFSEPAVTYEFILEYRAADCVFC